MSKPNTVLPLKSILVVDDFHTVLRTVKFSLEGKYKVYTLSKSEEVIDFLITTKTDLIILEYLMPVFSGFDLIPMIHMLPEYKHTPIFIITTEGTKTNVKKAISLGASDFIKKPFDPWELKQKIKSHIGV